MVVSLGGEDVEVRARRRRAVAACERPLLRVAGDVVPRKKPDPAVYQLALEKLALDPAESLVVEDSRNGLLAAVGAGLATVVTVSGYTRDEDFTESALVVTSLGDPDGERLEVLADPWGVRPVDALGLADLARLAGRQPSARQDT